MTPTTTTAEQPLDLAALLAPLTTACPLQEAVLATTIRDLSLAVEWAQLRPLQLPGTPWAAVVGHKRASDPLRAVLPLPLHSTALTPQQLHGIFAALAGLTLETLPAAMPPLMPSAEEMRRVLAARALVKERERRDKEGAGVEGDDEAESNKVEDEVKVDDRVIQDEDASSAPPPLSFDPDTLYIAICATDSSVVYYKLSRGIKKPADIPDE